MSGKELWNDLLIEATNAIIHEVAVQQKSGEIHLTKLMLSVQHILREAFEPRSAN